MRFENIADRFDMDICEEKNIELDLEQFSFKFFMQANKNWN